ncbi:MAG: hypothetical protein HFH09_04715 [Bacilli bacterium]|jgi:Flp pilus assembly protein TadG|nr:hypothetical protein [Bacilli bacterium]
MKNKGQALVEFIIILPVLLLLILGAIDFGNILYKEYTLENDLDYIVELVRQNKMTEVDYYVKQKELTKNIETKSTTTTITLSKKVVVNTPGLNRILGKNYQIKASRVISNE